MSNIDPIEVKAKIFTLIDLAARALPDRTALGFLIDLAATLHIRIKSLRRMITSDEVKDIIEDVGVIVARNEVTDYKSVNFLVELQQAIDKFIDYRPDDDEEA